MQFFEPAEEQKAAWREFVDSRPPNVKSVAEKFVPWVLYRIKYSGHRATVRSFQEHADGSVTLTVAVTADFNAVMFERNVFGIKPDDLEECDLPGADEPLGAAMSQDEANEHLDSLRVMVRPDLWKLDEAGKAVRI